MRRGTRSTEPGDHDCVRALTASRQAFSWVVGCQVDFQNGLKTEFHTKKVVTDSRNKITIRPEFSADSENGLGLARFALITEKNIIENSDKSSLFRNL